MPVPTTFDLSRVQRALGAKSGFAQPFFANEFLYPLLVVGDMSRSFGPEQFERRGVVSNNAVSTVPNPGVAQLIAIAPGGIVIETVNFFSTNPLTIAFCSVQTPPRTVLNPQTPDVFNVGGDPVQSISTGGDTATVIAGAQFHLDADAQKTIDELGWFVPTGSAFEVLCSLAFPEELLVTVQWREIPQAPGGP